MDWRSPLRMFIGLAAATAGAGLIQQPPAPARDSRPVAQMARVGLPGESKSGPARHVLQRADDGLFYLVAAVDGVPVRFVVDTGANVTVLSPADARRIAWRDGQIAGTATLATAGGGAAMRWARIGAISVAGHTMNDLAAALPDAGPATSLLGQDVLSQLRSVTQRGDRLTIE